MKLIINADDFGYSKGVNLGIVEAHTEGIVTSATMLVNMYGLSHAVSLARLHPQLGVGIHLTLTCGRPVRDDVPSLVCQDGQFHKLPDIFTYAKADDIQREFSSQIERFLATGLAPTHLDSHHHVHAHELALPIVLRLAERYNLPLRRVSNDPQIAYGTVKTTDLFHHDFYGDQVQLETLERLLAGVAGEQTAEVMCHPAYVDAYLLEGSSYALPRAKELRILTAGRIKRFISQMNIELITYREIS